MDNEEIIKENKLLREENEKLKTELQETKEHLKKYTSPNRCKKYYKENKEKLLTKMKENPISSEKRKEYNKNYYLKKKYQQTENIKE
jgi:hypothetical protein